MLYSVIIHVLVLWTVKLRIIVFIGFINSFILIYVLCILKRCLYFSSLSIVFYFLSEIMVMMVKLVSSHSCFSVIFARIKTCKLLTYEVYLMFIFMSMFYDQNAECSEILVVFMHLKLLPESEHEGYLSSLWWVFVLFLARSELVFSFCTRHVSTKFHLIHVWFYWQSYIHNL